MTFKRLQFKEADDEEDWPAPIAYALGSIYILLFLALFLFSSHNLWRQWVQLNSRRHLVAVHCFVAILAGTRLLLVLLGSLSSSSFIASWTPMPELLTFMLDSLCYGALLGACFFELAMFIRLGWAATLQVQNLAQAHRLMNIVYIACVLGILDELIVGVLWSADRDLHLVIGLFVGLELVTIILVMILLVSTLFDVAKMVEKRKKVAITSASWTPPLDAHNITDSQHHLKTPPLTLKFRSKLVVGFQGLPKRARIAFVAVLIGLALVAAQCAERLIETVFEIAGMSIEEGPEPSHLVYRFLEVVVGFGMSHASSVITEETDRSDRETGSISSSPDFQ
eukprot:c20548_g1_i1.p1 GENE.c20548_g1_i1~~c20548_g1_i1.p1  ORF type:complete len:382 (-),score=94.45 c20548_g1_i1:82-1095(-)